jgi:hypothetical protein
MGRLLIIDEDELASVVEEMISRRENECRPRGYQRESSCGGGITYSQLLYGPSGVPPMLSNPSCGFSGCGSRPMVSSCGTFTPNRPSCGGGRLFSSC